MAQRVGFYLSGPVRSYPAQVHPVLIRFGSLIVPSYGVLAAAGVLLGLLLVQRTARRVGLPVQHIWNLSVLALFVSLLGSRVLLVMLNWTVLRAHPSWLLGLAMIHHPLLAAIGAALALTVSALYARRFGLRLDATADALAPALSLGLAFEQIGALMVGASFGTESHLPWAVTYNDALAARWSAAPIGVALHPVQAYCALAFLAIAVLLWLGLPLRRQQGDVAGAWLVLAAITIFFTEFWRDRVGRGSLLHGALDWPQIAAILFLLCGAAMLRARKNAALPTPEPAHV